MEEDIKKKINQVEDYLCDVGLDLEYARDELNRLYDTLKEKNCDMCKYKKTMKCPNSSLCYSTKNKPYFKSKLDRED